MTEDNSTDEENAKTKWIKLECKPKNIAIGVFYRSQGKSRQDHAKGIYNYLETQVSIQMRDNEVILGWDLNAKLEITNNETKQKRQTTLMYDGKYRIHAATQNIITETGNKQIKGLKCKPSGNCLMPQ